MSKLRIQNVMYEPRDADDVIKVTGNNDMKKGLSSPSSSIKKE
jgi:hypothetical protein